MNLKNLLFLAVPAIFWAACSSDSDSSPAEPPTATEISSSATADPSVPTQDPSDPSNPTDPSSQTDPSNPADPSNPSDPDDVTPGEDEGGDGSVAADFDPDHYVTHVFHILADGQQHDGDQWYLDRKTDTWM